MKTMLSIACLLLVVCATVDARPKRSIIVSSPLVATVPVAASVPVATHSVVHSHPTTVVKTEQVHAGDHSSYSYSTEVKSHPVVHTHVAAAAPVAVSTVHHTVPTYSYGYYPAASYAASYPAASYAASYPSYYSPYSYVVGK